jgi:hypothetical protein
MGYRPFIDSPLDRYIYMLDSMILWLMISVFFVGFVCPKSLKQRLYEPGVFLGGVSLKMCVTRVLGVLGVLGGKPWFYTFWGSGACFGG